MSFRGLRRLLRPSPTPWPQAPPALTPILDGPKLTVVVVTYQMDRQLANTLHSLLPPYQLEISPEDYEIHVIDNGSAQPLSPQFWKLAGNIRYQHIPPGQASGNPGVAINHAVAQTRSPIVCIMIDGARMLTPRVLHWGVELAGISPRDIVEVRGWHLGPKLQNLSMAEGYDSDAEIQLLEKIGWPQNGYGLFEISVPAASMPRGFFGRAGESTCLFLHRELFDRLGGYDPRYSHPGGGLVNSDFFHRAVSSARRVFSIMGEGTFHQLHGGAATGRNSESLRDAFKSWKREYERLSRPWKSTPDYQPILIGHVPPQCRRWLDL